MNGDGDSTSVAQWGRGGVLMGMQEADHCVREKIAWYDYFDNLLDSSGEFSREYQGAFVTQEDCTPVSLALK